MKSLYTKDLVARLQQELGVKNSLAVPRIQKVVVSVGLSQGLKDAKMLETIEKTLMRITGQKFIKTVAKKSIASFKIRKGMVVGMKVTLRGQRMWDFLTRLLQFTFPRIRDFHGLPKKTIDAQGHLSIGFREHLVFPEIRSDEVEHVHGLEVTIVSTARSRKVGEALFRVLEFPFQT